MKCYYLPFCLVLILLNVHSSIPRIKTKSSKVQPPRKSTSNVPKTSAVIRPGQLFYKGKYLPIQLNLTEEYEVYAANYSSFPDELYYPRSSTIRDVEEFLGSCVNSTLELQTNKEKISKLRSGEEVYMRVAMHVIEFLCFKNFESNKADLCSGGLWVMTIATVISLVIN